MICPRPFLPLTLSFHRVNGLSNGPLAVGTLHHMPIPGPLLPSIISAKMSSTGVSSVIRVARFLSLPDAWGVVRRTNGNRGAQLSSYACSQVNCFGLQLIRSSGSSFACTMKHWEDVSLAAQGASRVFPAPHTGFLCCPEQAAWRPFHGHEDQQFSRWPSLCRRHVGVRTPGAGKCYRPAARAACWELPGPSACLLARRARQRRAALGAFCMHSDQWI